MNREIKFRFWNTKQNRYEKGYGYIFSTDGFNGMSYIVPQQYTGLKDKNGVDIYEGDIIQGGSRLPDEVIFRDGLFQTSGGYRIMYSDAVIGNVYENPELLEKGKD